MNIVRHLGDRRPLQTMKTANKKGDDPEKIWEDVSHDVNFDEHYADVVDVDDEEKEENEDRGKHLGGQELRLVEEDS